MPLNKMAKIAYEESILQIKQNKKLLRRTCNIKDRIPNIKILYDLFVQRLNFLKKKNMICLIGIS